MKLYLVTCKGGTFTYTEPVLDDGTGPSYEEGWLHLAIADTPSRAKMLWFHDAPWRERWSRYGDYLEMRALVISDGFDEPERMVDDNDALWEQYAEQIEEKYKRVLPEVLDDTVR